MRPATYESQAEADVLVELFSDREGRLRNTVFAMLTPDGRRTIGRTGRSPSFVFESAEEMAAGMREIASHYESKAELEDEERALPTIANVRLALNVAACDALPIIVGTLGKKASEKEAKRWRERLAECAWRDSLIGKVHYTLSNEAAELGELELDAEFDTHVLLPDEFGRPGELLGSFSSKDSKLGAKLAMAVAKAKLNKAGDREHIRRGTRAGIEWETAIPQTDGVKADARRRRR